MEDDNESSSLLIVNQLQRQLNDEREHAKDVFRHLYKKLDDKLIYNHRLFELDNEKLQISREELGKNGLICLFLKIFQYSTFT